MSSAKPPAEAKPPVEAKKAKRASPLEWTPHLKGIVRKGMRDFALKHKKFKYIENRMPRLNGKPIVSNKVIRKYVERAGERFYNYKKWAISELESRAEDIDLDLAALQREKADILKYFQSDEGKRRTKEEGTSVHSVLLLPNFLNGISKTFDGCTDSRRTQPIC
jgi:hypothetical protein